MMGSKNGERHDRPGAQRRLDRSLRYDFLRMYERSLLFRRYVNWYYLEASLRMKLILPISYLTAITLLTPLTVASGGLQYYSWMRFQASVALISMLTLPLCVVSVIFIVREHLIIMKPDDSPVNEPVDDPTLG